MEERHTCTAKHYRQHKDLKEWIMTGGSGSTFPENPLGGSLRRSSFLVCMCKGGGWQGHSSARFPFWPPLTSELTPILGKQGSKRAFLKQSCGVVLLFKGLDCPVIRAIYIPRLLLPMLQ